jgi:predicted TIM-barrel fold metal-dependent hydrolase
VFVFDSQVHVWSPNTAARPWADPASAHHHPRFASLDAEELLVHMREAGVDAAAVVQPAFEGDQNDIALAAAGGYPDRFVAIGRVAVDRADPAWLPEWRTIEGIRGVRVTFTREKRSWLTDGTADWFWQAGEDASIPVMVYAPGQSDVLEHIAAEHPGLRFAVDHFGLEGTLDGRGLVEAAVSLERLARYPNVAVKASALPVHAADDYPFTSLHEPIRRVVAAFGADRVFWGSDMTRLRCNYAEAVTYMAEVPGLSDDDVTSIMGRALAAWLDWDPRGR